VAFKEWGFWEGKRANQSGNGVELKIEKPGKSSDFPGFYE